MEYLVQLFKSWAQVAWNWLKTFFVRVWGWIVSWWSKLKDYVKDLLSDLGGGEVVIVDPREENGYELVEAIRQYQPETVTIDDIDSLVTVGINGSSVKKVENLKATTQQADQFDAMSANMKGVIRING